MSSKKIQTLLRGERELRALSISELEKHFNIEYLPTLSFQKPSFLASIEKRCEKALRKEQIDRQQKWLGALYEKEILGGAVAEGLALRWIDETLGYGLFALRPLPPQAFIGEYSGEIKKRRWFEPKRNDYRFSYCISESYDTPFLIDAEKKGNLVRFINHSEQPNLKPVAVYAGKIMHIILYSLQAIPAGAQLTYDYGAEYWLKRKQPLLNVS